MKFIGKLFGIAFWFLFGWLIGYISGLVTSLTELKEAIVNKINKALFGTSASEYWNNKRYRHTYRPYTTYTSYTGHQERLRDPRNHLYYSITRAEEVLRSMKEEIDLYGHATMLDLKDILGLYTPTDYDNKLFWNDLTDAKVIAVPGTSNTYRIEWPLLDDNPVD